MTRLAPGHYGARTQDGGWSLSKLPRGLKIEKYNDKYEFMLKIWHSNMGMYGV